ncbi:MAG: hypothetical protein LBT38_03165 [Deltaproteobacteria bacterium]|jgi:hypothetical protein|nr:hypothetical protein [Deltaproteobacteria bacterium]
MFKRLAAITKTEERAEIFSLLMVGFGLMSLILAPLGLLLGAMAVMEMEFFRHRTALEAIVAMALALWILTFPVALAKTQARRAFELDNRNFLPRFKEIISFDLRRYLALIIFTWGLLTVYGLMSLMAWSIVLFLVIQALVWIPFFYKNQRLKIFPAYFREAKAEELPDNLPKILKTLPTPPNWNLRRILVDSQNQDILPWPYLLGETMVVPQKALTMTMGALKHRIVTAILGNLVKVEGLTMILRGLAMSLTVPLALVFLGGFGFFWRFPQDYSPILIPCLWLAVGLSHLVSKTLIRFVQRLLERKLSSAAVLATWDVPGFKASLEAASRWDLEPDESPWWFWFSRTRPGALEQIAQIKEQLQVLTKTPKPNTPPVAPRTQSFEASKGNERANA